MNVHNDHIPMIGVVVGRVAREKLGLESNDCPFISEEFRNQIHKPQRL